MSGDENVKLWLDDLRDLVHYIEDVLDDFATECARGGSSTMRSSWMKPSCFSGQTGGTFDPQLWSRIEKIGARLDSILEQKKDLELIESGGSIIRKTTSHYSSKRMTTSLPECKVVGRQEDQRVVLGKLLKEETEHLSVIPIVGIGGLGKTTLAKSVFNHSTVVEAFPLRGWACVSDNFNKLAIARALLGSLTEGSAAGQGDDLNVLHNKLREILSEQKFLIVLDDYWSKHYPDWDEIYNLFNLGAKGSKVIVTTRDEGVASMMTNHPTLYLEKLYDGDCLTLLAYHALGVSTFDAHTHLKPIAEEIALKCKGLPLAAKAIGGLLRSKPKTASAWKDIRDSKIWNLESDKDDIFLALKLSYFHLPPHLKSCFVFCAIFPKEYEFDRDDLALLWMAEGLVEMEGKNAKSCTLDQGRKQFDELLSRSFFQPSTQNKSLFVMHDLMHDLAISIGGNMYLNVDEGNEIQDVNYKSPEHVRHMLYSSISSEMDAKKCEMDAKFGKYGILKGLRTFIAAHRGISGGRLSDQVLEGLLPNWKHLRVLSLREYYIDKIPNCIDRLNHLRYLNFSKNNLLEKLPEPICTLYNLEALILNGCSKLNELPPGMDKLINLKCLDVRHTPELKKMPVELGHMHNLEILSKFIVGGEDGLRLKVLGNVKHLQGEISIWDLQNVEDIKDARDARLSSKVGLTTLALQWSLRNDRNADKEKKVLEFLQPHREIKEVKIDGYGGKSFPLWIGSPSSMTHITKVRLECCAKITTLPSFGLLPCLRELEMERMDALSSVGSEFYGNGKTPPFPSLEVLAFTNMPAWQVWSSSCGDKEIKEPFPQLIRLTLHNCPRLVSQLPHRLCSLVNLEIYECPLLKASPCMADLSSLKYLKLKDCNHDLLAMVSSVSPSAAVEIYLERIQKLKYLNEDTLRAAEHLMIKNCDELIGLWEDNVSFLAEKKERASSSLSTWIGFRTKPMSNQHKNESEPVVVSLTHLKYLFIDDCENLQKLPNNMQKMTSLIELRIEGCSKLHSLPVEIMSCNLEKLCIKRCGISLEVAKLPSTLITLQVHQCEILERLPEDGTTINNDGRHNGDYSSSSSNNVMHLQLEEIDIDYCNIRKMPSFLSMLTKLTKLGICNLEVDVFPKLPSCLRSLKFRGFNEIKALPQQMHTTLTSLQCLELHGLSIESLPEGGLPLSIEELSIQDCPKLKQPLEEWGLYKHAALKKLVISGSQCLQEGGIMTCFPPLPSDWLFFPPNLEILEIGSQDDMIGLLNGFRDHFTSLRQLRLFRCPKLQFLPKEGFPPTLEYFRIYECSPDIESKCSQNGEYAPLIESIPNFGFSSRCELGVASGKEHLQGLDVYLEGETATGSIPNFGFSSRCELGVASGNEHLQGYLDVYLEGDIATGSIPDSSDSQLPNSETDSTFADLLQDF